MDGDDWWAVYGQPTGDMVCPEVCTMWGSDESAYIAAANPAVVLGLLDDNDALRAELAHMTEARDAASAEVWRLTAAVRRVRELHRESRGSMSGLYPNPICECGKDYPCPTIRALDSTPKTGGES